MEYPTSRNKNDCVKLSARDQIADSGSILSLSSFQVCVLIRSVTGFKKEIRRLRMILEEQKWELRNPHEEDRENLRAY
jgi:hypothetical protein